jgi:hypothetical protein
MKKFERPMLPAEDRRAVDLLLDPTAASQSGVMEIIAPIDRERLDAMQSTLRLLEHIPTADPPDDLVARTLKLIDSNPIPPPSAMPPPQMIDPSAPNNPSTSS